MFVGIRSVYTRALDSHIIAQDRYKGLGLYRLSLLGTRCIKRIVDDIKLSLAMFRDRPVRGHTACETTFIAPGLSCRCAVVHIVMSYPSIITQPGKSSVNSHPVPGERGSGQVPPGRDHSTKRTGDQVYTQLLINY